MSVTLVLISVIVLTLSIILHSTGLIFDRQKLKTAGHYLLLSALILLIFTFALFWVETGRPPIYGTFESMLLASISGITLYFYVTKGRPKKEMTGLIFSLAVFFMLAFGFHSDKTPALLGPAFKSRWLWFHIGFSWLSFSAFVLASILAIMDLVKKDPGKKYDELSFKLIIFGFLCHSVGLASGALWANELFGKYWGWDPVETWYLIVWFLYAAYIHLRVTLGWSGKKISIMAAISPLAVIISYGGIIFLNGEHSPLF